MRRWMVFGLKCFMLTQLSSVLSFCLVKSCYNELAFKEMLLQHRTGETSVKVHVNFTHVI